jgi:Fe-S cluster assembly protein SufB
MKTEVLKMDKNVQDEDMNAIEQHVQSEYKYGFVTDIEADEAPKGLTEDTIRFISAKKNEPSWMLDWRLKAYQHWLKMEEPTWANVKFDPIDYQDIYTIQLPSKKLLPTAWMILIRN